MHGDIIVKLTTKILKQIIKEEISNIIAEAEEQDGEVVEKFDSKEEAKAFINRVGNTAMKIKEKDGKFHVIETE